MRCFHGCDGEIFAVADPYRFFDVPMEDCGDGFDWRVSDCSLGYWSAEVPVRFDVIVDGLRRQLFPVEVYHQMGRAGFGRCLAGSLVRASGVCNPLTLLAKPSSWEVNIETVISERPALNNVGRGIDAEMGDATAMLRDVSVSLSSRNVVARLWPTREGALVGQGTLNRAMQGIVLNYDNKGVRYELS